MKKTASYLLVSCYLWQWSLHPADAFQPVSQASRRRRSRSFVPLSRVQEFKLSKRKCDNFHRRGPSIARLRSTETDYDNQFSDAHETVGNFQNSTLLTVPKTVNSQNSTLFETTEQTATDNPGYPPTPTFTECLTFALPALGIYICPPLMSLIDASFIGRLSTSVELAALGPASAISDSAPLPLLFLSIASTNLIAKSYAQKDDAASKRVSRTALGMGTVCSILLTGLVFGLAGPLSAGYCGSQAAGLTAACTDYVAIRALALPAVVVATIAQAILIGTKDTKTPMYSVALAGICNLLGDLVLVKGFRWGIAGAAWATSASQYIAAGLLLRTLNQRGILQRPKTGNDEPGRAATMKQLLSFIPFLFIMSVKIGWHNSCTATAASMGSITAAAHTALSSVVMVCMVLGDVGSSLSQAFLPPFERSSTVEKGTPRIGSGTKSSQTVSTFDVDAAMPTIRQLLKCTVSISAIVTAFAAIAVGIFGGQITSDVRVLAQMRQTLPWILATLCFHGSAVTLEGLLLSSKKFRPLSFFYSFLAATVVAFQVATRKFGLGLAGVWGCYLWFCSSRVLAFSVMGGLLRPRRWWERIRSGNRSDAVNPAFESA